MLQKALDHADWDGGFYELALELGAHGHNRVDVVLDAVWREAAVQGCFAVAGPPLSHVAAKRTLAAPEVGHLRGVVRLPSGATTVCGAFTTRHEEGPAWFGFYLPLGALSEVDPRIGGYPFGEEGGPSSLAWRAPIDAWLRDVATRVFATTPFALGLIGFEVAGDCDSQSLASVPEDRHTAYLIPTQGELRYFPANR